MPKKVSWRYNKNPHQREFHSDDVAKYLHLSAGMGAGKTHALIMKLIKLSFINRDMPGGLLCPTYGDFKRDVKPLFEEILEDHRIKYTYRDTKFRFPWTKAPLYVVTGKNKIRGPNWAYGGINEVTLIPYVRYREFIARIRLKDARCSQIVSCGTPEGFGTEYHEHFIEKPFSPKVRVIYGSTYDNQQNLSEDYIDSLKASFDNVMLDAYLKGLFVNMVGNRFYYSYDQRCEDSSIQPFNRGEDVHVAIDFNVEHMTATVWRFDGFRLEGIDEVVIPNNANTNRMCDELKRRGYLPSNTTIYPDPSGNSRRTSGQSDVEIIRQHGYMDVKFRTKAPGFRQRQLNANNLFDKGQVKIHPDRMPAMKKDFLAVTQDPATAEKVKDNPKLTHASDGFDYMADHLFPFSGKRAQVIVERYR
jgi:hypothetical protein